MSSEQNLRSPPQFSKKVSDVDSISLNGPGAGSRTNISEDLWHDDPKKVLSQATACFGMMSLSDIIVQHQTSDSGSSVNQRANRFWSYGGSTHIVACHCLKHLLKIITLLDNHMAQNPEVYTSEELSRFAATTAETAVGLACPSSSPAPVYSNPDINALPIRPKTQFRRSKSQMKTEVKIHGQGWPVNTM